MTTRRTASLSSTARPFPGERRVAERDVQNAIRLALTKRDDVVLWRNTTGLAVHDGRKQRFGLAVGSADLIGILRLPARGDDGSWVPGAGVFLAIECKAEGGRVTPEQALFLALVQRMGGVAFVATSADEAELRIVEAIEAARRSSS